MYPIITFLQIYFFKFSNQIFIPGTVYELFHFESSHRNVWGEYLKMLPKYCTAPINGALERNNSKIGNGALTWESCAVLLWDLHFQAVTFTVVGRTVAL